MSKAEVLNRFHWLKLTFGVFLAFLLLGYVLELLRLPEAFLWMAAPTVMSFLAFTIAFGAFARALDESAVSWIATVMLLPVFGILIAYFYLGQKYNRAIKQDCNEQAS